MQAASLLWFLLQFFYSRTYRWLAVTFVLFLSPCSCQKRTINFVRIIMVINTGNESTFNSEHPYELFCVLLLFCWPEPTSPLSLREVWRMSSSLVLADLLIQTSALWCAILFLLSDTETPGFVGWHSTYIREKQVVLYTRDFSCLW